MNSIQRYVMRLGIKIFTDYVPTRIIRQVLPNVDHIELRNGLNTIARLTR